MSLSTFVLFFKKMESLRNRFVPATTSNYQKYSNVKDNESKFVKPMPSSHFVGVLGLILLTFALVIIIEKQLPKALTIAEEDQYPDSFIAERAYNILKNLTSVGPRIAGSYENEVVAVQLITTEINDILKGSNPIHVVEVDVQKASGGFNLAFLDGMTNVYQDVQNVVVKVGSKINSAHSLLINCHFDSVMDSPGKFFLFADCLICVHFIYMF